MSALTTQNTGSDHEIPLALYIHFPWCVKKCPYCDFNSHQLAFEHSLDAATQQQYVDALVLDFKGDLEYHSDDLKDREISSIFLGGGTPSLFSGNAIDSLLCRISDLFQLSPNCETTMEANPGSLEHDRFESYLSAGINRLSFGVQSFNDNHLKALGRIHDSRTAKSAISNAALAGFDNINLDIMFGLPDQTLDQLQDDLDQALDFDPNHLSCYQLTLEPNTVFFNKPPTLPKEDDLFIMQQQVVDHLSDHELERYEVSAFSKPGKQCRHNLNYWQFGDYLGIGAGAHGKVSSQINQISRSWKEKHPRTYLDKVSHSASHSNRKPVEQADQLFEFLLNGLRLKAGFSLLTLENRTSVSAEHAFERLQSAFDKNWLELDDQTIRCSRNGYLFIDEILQLVLPEQ